MNYKIAFENCIFQYMSGSHAYGTNTPESDVDYRGIFIMPLEYGFQLFAKSKQVNSVENNLKAAQKYIQDGFTQEAIEQITAALSVDNADLNFGQSTVQDPDGEDSELHELRKFMQLAAKCNPNIIEALWIEKNIKISTPIWETIKANRDLFLSSKVRYTFAGYAVAQLHRIELHRGYLLKGEVKRPVRADFGLPSDSKIPPENQNAVLSLPDEWIKPELKEQVRKEKEFFRALKNYKSYKEWEEKRNPARKALEKKFGFDSKHAMHLVRLVRMATEILTGKGVLVHRPDAEELNDIRYGKWDYSKVLEVAGNLDEKLTPLYNSCTLQKKANHKKIAKLYQEICEKHYGIKLNSKEEDLGDVE